MSTKKQFFNFKQYKLGKRKNACIPETARISFVQDGSYECSPVVKVDQLVQEGQQIGRGEGNNAAIHAPIPGVVTHFDYYTMPNGKRALAADIKLKGSFTFTGKQNSLFDWTVLSPAEIISLLKQRGVLNTFSIKVASLAEQSFVAAENKVLFVRLFDEYPDVQVDSFITSTKTEKVFTGSEIVAKAIEATAIVYFVSSSVSKEFYHRLEYYAQKRENTYIFKVDTTRYPCGTQRRLASSLEKSKETTLQQYAQNVGLSIDSETALNVYNGIVLSKPVISKIIQVTGKGMHSSSLFKVKIGTSIADLVKECGGCKKPPTKIVINGLINGTAIADIKAPITKSVKSVHLMFSQELPAQSVSNCIHCGRCFSVCPQFLHPDILYASFSTKVDTDKAILSTIHLCDNCGLCNTVCPARLPLSRTIALMKEK